MSLSPRAIYRHFYWARKDRAARRLLEGCELVVIMGGTLGDNLMLSTVAQERARRNLRGLCISTPHPALFDGLPGVEKVVPVDWGLLAAAARIGIKGVHPFYSAPLSEPDCEASPSRHILAEVCHRAGLRGSVGLRPYLTPTAAELDAAAPFTGALVLQSSGLSGPHGMRNKEWGAENFASVARALAPRLRLVQIGSAGDPPLPGADDLRGKTSLRETAAILARAAGFVGLVGFPMHLARAVDCPAVIVYGGREKPWQSGYVCNLNLATSPACSPCWRWQTCAHDRTCLAEITPAQVVSAVEELLRRPRHELPVERHDLNE